MASGKVSASNGGHQMLYASPRPATLFGLFRRLFTAIASRRQDRIETHIDTRALDGLPPHALEELGLRRGQDGSYRLY
jgi:hypothetical protein